jgi:Protein of unknown function (DUF2490)
MYKPARIGIVLVLAEMCFPVLAQETAGQYRGELDVYLNTGPRTRVLIQSFYEDTPRTNSSDTNFAAFFDLALRPLFRRPLRDTLDVFREKYLTFRAGYLRRTSVTDGQATRENRPILEVTARFPLKNSFVVVDRSRGEFRFIENKPFSERYRNRLWMERDFKFEGLGLTPFVFDEVFYDTRYGAWTTNRLAAGVQILVGKHMIWQPYVFRQRNTRGTPQYINAVALNLNLYFR